MYKAVLFFLFAFIFSTQCFAQSNTTETLTITTYYPSPYGVYRNLRLNPSNEPATNVDRGLMYYDNGTDELKYWAGSVKQWVNLTGGAGGVAGGWEYNATTGHVYNVNTGNIGIGTKNPQEKLHIVGIENGSFPYQDLVFMEGEGELALTLFSSANDPHQECKIEPYRARGRMSSRSPLLENDTIFQIDPAGYSGITNGYKSAARIDVLADGNFNDNSGPGRIVFSTTPADDTTAKPVPTERMVIKNNGNVGIGVANPLCRLHIQDLHTHSGIIDNWDEFQILLCECGTVVDSYGLGHDGDGDFFLHAGAGGGFKFYNGNSLMMLLADSGRLGIGTSNPSYILDVQHATSKVNSRNGYLTNGADYAEFFENEAAIPDLSLVGFNAATGKVRVYREGDDFIGIVSSKSGFVGNGDKGIENNSKYTLVGLVGQLDFDKSQVSIKGRKVFTKDNKYIGLLLSNGKVFIK
jgi:hypothetical protein